LGEPERISTAYAQQSWPIYAKLHGDFQSETLKNTNDELATQDARMRDILLDTCRNQGLAVSGYSGRDASIMSVLREAINDGKGFPNGLFWFVRETDHLYQGLIDLIKEAKNAGVDACFVKAESFDELFSDIIRYLPETEDLTIKLDDKAKIAPRKIDLTNMSASVPFVRTNALPITDFPKTVRLVDCEIGGAKEIRELMEGKESSLIASRIKKGVLAFGDDGEIRRVFGNNDLRSLDTHSIIEERLSFESGERSLLRDALFRALSARSGFELHRARHRYFFRADRGQPKFELKALQAATQRLSGTTSGGVPWTEACQLRLDYRMGRLWLLLSPVVLVDFDDDTSDDAKAQAKELQRERRVRRYNQQSNAILDAWIQAIFGTTRDPETLGIEGGTGIGARFEISPVTGFSGVQS
ncbi:MAG: SIR2 family protein, partial [Pseudomonadota bacterium]